MDPSAMMSGGAFQPYTLPEIWPFQINGGGGDTSSAGGGGVAGLDLSRLQQLVAERNNSFNNNNINERKFSGEDPMVLEHGGGSRKRVNGEVLGKVVVSTSNANDMIDSDGKRVKTRGSRDDNLDSEAGPEANSSKPADQKMKQAEPSKQDYIHVRARRGQATDSHSLAERARREKISERMKILQDLVPGCNKVIGKASVLDEIINYIQSLQRQVEFLSMKLEAVNSRMDPGIEGFPSTEFGQPAYETPGTEFGSRATKDYGKDASPEWLHMQLGGGYEGRT